MVQVYRHYTSGALIGPGATPRLQRQFDMASLTDLRKRSKETVCGAWLLSPGIEERVPGSRTVKEAGYRPGARRSAQRPSSPPPGQIQRFFHKLLSPPFRFNDHGYRPPGRASPFPRLGTILLQGDGAASGTELLQRRHCFRDGAASKTTLLHGRHCLRDDTASETTLLPGRGCFRDGAASGMGLLPGRGCFRDGAASGTGLLPGRGCFRDGAASGTGLLQGWGCFRDGAASGTGLLQGRGCFRDGAVSGHGRQNRRHDRKKGGR
ncbi:hypothetical protein ACOMHN_052901 [Nucella lapillus]